MITRHEDGFILPYMWHMPATLLWNSAASLTAFAVPKQTHILAFIRVVSLVKESASRNKKAGTPSPVYLEPSVYGRIETGSILPQPVLRNISRELSTTCFHRSLKEKGGGGVSDSRFYVYRRRCKRQCTGTLPLSGFRIECCDRRCAVYPRSRFT